nr:hypothetical protein [Tanacetum cinerariifolium]
MKRFMNYLEEQTDGEAMINSIQNGNQPFLVIAQVSLAGTAQNAPPTPKDPKQTKNLMDINIDALYNILKQNQGDVNDALGYKKKVVVNDKKEDKKDDEKKRAMRKVKCYNYKKEGHFAKDCNKEKVKDYNYYKTKMLLAKKDSDEQVLLAEDQA